MIYVNPSLPYLQQEQREGEQATQGQGLYYVPVWWLHAVFTWAGYEYLLTLKTAQFAGTIQTSQTHICVPTIHYVTIKGAD